MEIESFLFSLHKLSNTTRTISYLVIIPTWPGRNLENIGSDSPSDEPLQRHYLSFSRCDFHERQNRCNHERQERPRWFIASLVSPEIDPSRAIFPLLWKLFTLWSFQRTKKRESAHRRETISAIIRMKIFSFKSRLGTFFNLEYGERKFFAFF